MKRVRARSVFVSAPPLNDAMLRSMAEGRCPYHDGPHEFVLGICRLCLEDRDTLVRRSIRGQLYYLRDGPLVADWLPARRAVRPDTAPRD